MKILVVLACVAMAAARPEAPLQGYNYAAPRPIVHGGVSSSAVHASSHSHGGGYYTAQAPVHVAAPVHAAPIHVSAPAPVYQGTGFGSAISGGGAFDSGHSAGFGGAISGSSFSGASASGGSLSGGSFGGGSFGGGSFGGGSFTGGAQAFAPQQTVVQKHIYVHVPPQEPEETRPQQVLSQGVARKHYKIIFIKTPNVQPSAAQIALQQSQQEEKTIVYVLVKKPDEQADINIPQLPSLPPSKPEVYFIKYKANKGASHGGLVGGAIGGGAIGGGVASAGHGFDASLGSLASSGSGASSSVVGGGVPHTDYGAPAAHQGYP
ncbi:keratin, type II cytoskeletal 1-like [Armigeres subalbatus]|uniref:keratin, type II cytoskeletal 1-like n=1 Tax=Armigeres subalbatus TaxID=124917 RepID=UPI002ED32CD4